MNPASNVHIEKEDVSPVAVIFNGFEYGKVLKEALFKQNLRVVYLESQTQPLSVLEKPAYIFFFAGKKTPLSLLKNQFAEIQNTGGKIILILDNLDLFDEKTITGEDQTKYRVMEIRGVLKAEQLELFVSKVIRFAFSSRNLERQLIIGNSQEIIGPETERVIVKKSKQKFEINKKHLTIFGAVFLFAVLVITPMIVFGVSSLLAFSSLGQTKEAIFQGQFTVASQKAQNAQVHFARSKEIIKIIAGPLQLLGLNKPLDKIFSLLILGESTAEAGNNVSVIASKISGLTSGFISGSSQIDLVGLSSQLRGEISPIAANLGLMEAQVLGVSTIPGMPMDKLKKYLDEIPNIRKAISGVESFLTVLPQIAPATEKKTYLVVFQNSAELRATGGFIGSYGLVNFDQGRLVNWQIYDIYSADGQLRGRISPPDEILHYAGEPNWYMRDANWSPDWPLSAKRLEWFLEKETGQKVDGVIGVSLGTISKFLEATGPIEITDLNDTVTAENFFHKAEYSAEINFFPGSTQKRDYLGAVAKSLLEKIVSGSQNNLPKLGQALLASLQEKDLIFYFNSPVIQKTFSVNGWAGEIAPEECQKKGYNCISVVDSNLGSNKANYFVSKGLAVSSAIAKDGAIDTTITINYKNDSPSETWPGGRYKNYLRILIPAGSKMTDFSIGDTRVPWVTPILTEKELAKVTLQQFLVLQTMEGPYSSFGALVEVPIGQTKKVVFRFRHPYRLQISSETPSFTMNFIKQPGTGKDPLDFVVDFPSFLLPATPLVFPQKLIYNSDLSVNRKFEINFKRQI